MPIFGSCLCGGVRFEVSEVSGPSEICHCVRCQKKSGATALTMILVESSSFRLHSGQELIQRYDAPILNKPPAYSAHFCRSCGSPVPPAVPSGSTLEIPAGLFDDDPGVRPSKHIFTDFMHSWDEVLDELPQYDLRALVQERWGRELPEGFEAVSHAGVNQKI